MLAETLCRRDDLQRRRTALVPYSEVARAVVRLVVREINLHARAETLLRAGFCAPLRVRLLARFWKAHSFDLELFAESHSISHSTLPRVS